MAKRFANGAFVADVSTSTAVGGGVSVINPEGVALVVTHAIADIATAAASTATITVGFSSAAASTATTILFDALTTTAAGAFSNHTSGNAGTAGVAAATWTSGAYLTLSHSNAQSTALVMNLVIQYVIRST